ncbi:MAG: exo-alpha-sialidase [Acidimicrobiia bacterium]|nr:exo-alpha-sialidase [Acidimicrobiia bacterium]
MLPRRRYRPSLLLAVPMLVGSLLLIPSAGADQLAVEPVTVAPGTSEATNDNGQRKLVQTKAGTLELIFVQRNGTIDQIVVASSSDNGRTWSEPVLLSRPGVSARLGSLAEGPRGQLHASWVDYETVGHVWYAVRQDGTWSPASKISPGPTYAGFPVLAAEGDRVHVLWYSSVPDEAYDVGSRYEIIHVVNTGGVWGPTTTVVSQGGLDALNPAIAQDREGVVHTAWYERDVGRYQVHYAFLNEVGEWQGPSILSSDASDALGVAMDVDPSGIVHIVWEQFGDRGAEVLYAALGPDGWSDPVMVAAAPTVDPVIASDDAGRVFAAWSDRRQVFVAELMDGRWSDAFILGAGAHPTIAAGEQVRIAWTRPGPAGSEVVVADLLGAGPDEGISLPAGLVATSAVLFVVALLTLGAFFYRSRT